MPVAEVGILQGFLEECHDAFLRAYFGFVDGVHGNIVVSFQYDFSAKNLSVISFKLHDYRNVAACAAALAAV